MEVVVNADLSNSAQEMSARLSLVTAQLAEEKARSQLIFNFAKDFEKKSIEADVKYRKALADLKAAVHSQERGAHIKRRHGDCDRNAREIVTNTKDYLSKCLAMDDFESETAKSLQKKVLTRLIRSLCRDYKAKYEVGELAALIGGVWENGTKFGPDSTCKKATSKAQQTFSLLLQGVCDDQEAQDRLLRDFIDVQAKLGRLPMILSEQAKKAIIKPYCEQLQIQIEKAALRNFIFENISTRKWDRMAQYMFSDFDPASQSFVPALIDGIHPPVMPKSHKLSKWAKDLCDEVQFKWDPKTKVASVHMWDTVLAAMESLDTQRESIGLKSIDIDELVTVNIKSDACGLGNGRQLTPMCFTFPKDALTANSPHETCVFVYLMQLDPIPV
jgi:hypothetical protein